MLDDLDRAELNGLVLDALQASGGSPDGAAVSSLLASIRSADMVGRAWPDELRDEVMAQWARRVLKEAAKRESTVIVDYKGHKHVKSTMIGVRSVGGGFQQALMSVTTWAELDGWRHRIRRQADSLEVNLHAVARLDALREAVPDSEGPGEAAAALGTTVEAWIESAS